MEDTWKQLIHSSPEAITWTEIHKSGPTSFYYVALKLGNSAVALWRISFKDFIKTVFFLLQE